MTNRKKEYKEPSLDVIKLRMPKLLSASDPADEPSGARRYDFDE